jgi:hypothetical protein
MKFISKILLLISLALSVFSCQKDLKVPLPEHQKRLVVNSFLNPGSSPEVYLTRSFGPLEDLETIDLHVEDATVDLYEGSALLGTLSYQDTLISSWGVNGDSLVKPVGKYYSESLNIEAGKTYEIRVSHPDYESVKATTTMPNPAEILEVSLQQNVQRIAIESGYKYSQSILNVRFQDVAGSEEAYAAKLFIEYESLWQPGQYDIEEVWEVLPITGRNETGAYTGDGSWGTDEGKDGQIMEVEFLADLPNAYLPDDEFEELNIRRIFLHFYTANGDSYRYIRDLSKQNESYSGGFSFFPPEAIIVPNNIENGYGIFGGLSIQKEEYAQ